ncbi:MAG: Minor capsid protein [Bacteriophage sp.]|nr:MAG: Minor capsid protein [Bacteriophage sp.]
MNNGFIGLIPFRDVITVIKENETPNLNEWGEPIYSNKELIYNAHIAYNSKLESISVANGDVITYTANIYIKGRPDIDFVDKVQFTDDLGHEVEKPILQIVPYKDFSKKVMAVKVVV